MCAAAVEHCGLNHLIFQSGMFKCVVDILVILSIPLYMFEKCTRCLLNILEDTLYGYWNQKCCSICKNAHFIVIIPCYFIFLMALVQVWFFYLKKIQTQKTWVKDAIVTEVLFFLLPIWNTWNDTLVYQILPSKVNLQLPKCFCVCLLACRSHSKVWFKWSTLCVNFLFALLLWQKALDPFVR